MPGAGRVLFVTRKYPPAVGGMETLSENIYRALGRVTDQPHLIALGRSQIHLIWWAPVAAARTSWHILRNDIDQVIVGDALLFAIAQPVLSLTGRNVRTNVLVHGLDLTFEVPGYRAIVQRTLSRADQILANSRSTRDIALGLGMDPDRVGILHPGLDVPSPSDAQRERARARLQSALSITASTKVLLTLGRLVRRKGARWFVREVLPHLDPPVVYVVAGTGPEHKRIRAAAEQRGVGDRVILLGMVDDSTADTLMLGADLFVQPNIVVPGDVEGFGIATIEAALRATPVVAADLQGLRDAVVNGVTGHLYPPEDADAATAKIKALLADRQELARLGRVLEEGARARYSIQRVAADLDGLLRQRSGHPEQDRNERG